MGNLPRALGCAFLLTLSGRAQARERIDYPSSSQMYALLAADVQARYGTLLPRVQLVARRAASPWLSRPAPYQLALPVRTSFAPLATRFTPLHDFTMPSLASDEGPPIALDMNSILNARQGIFPEEQRSMLHSPFDAMLTFTIGGIYGDHGTFSIVGGVPGAVWSVAHQ